MSKRRGWSGRTLVALATGATMALGVGAALAITADGDRTKTLEAAVKGGTAKNVIFLLGDGMGDSEISPAITPTAPPGRFPASTRSR